MKPFTDIQADLLDNSDQFDPEFFKGFPLRDGAPPIDLPGGLSKTYRFPTWYGDVTCAIAIFMCDYDAAARLLPDPAMRPVSMPRGRAVVTVSNYIYRKVGGIPGYNEVAMTIPVILDGAGALPVLPLVTDHPAKGYYVFAMPVTSLENMVRGHKYWGLPKTLNEIQIEPTSSTCSVRTLDEDGQEVFNLSVPTQGRLKTMRETGTVCSVLDGSLLRSTTTFAGEFAFNMRLGALLKRGASVDDPGPNQPGEIELGPSPQAAVLRELKLERRPFQTRFASSMNACFDLAPGMPGGPESA